MANFITCWLKDPGDLPPGDGPPGGNGIVIPPDDDDDDRCTGFTNYCQCAIFPPRDWQDVADNENLGCTKCDVPFPKICDGTEPDCRVNPATGCMVCKADAASMLPCEISQCCTNGEVPCTGYKCNGDGTLDVPCDGCDPCGAGGGRCTDRKLWEGGCKDVSFGCDGWQHQDANGYDVCKGCYKKQWQCKAADNVGQQNCLGLPGGGGGGDPTGPSTPGPSVPGVPQPGAGEKCWKCPSYGCCEQTCNRDLSGNCPDACYDSVYDCNDNCSYYCWECNTEEQKCMETAKTSCSDKCDMPTKADCDPYCLEDETKGYCWSCPGDIFTSLGCCVRDTPKVNGECPFGTERSARRCNKHCMKLCYKCDPSDGSCSEVGTSCDTNCGDKGWYDTKDDCDYACIAPPCTLDCYACVKEAESLENGTEASESCKPLTVTCYDKDIDTCESLGPYYTMN